MDALMFAVALETALLQLRIVEGSFQYHSASFISNTSLNKVHKIEKERTVVKNVLSKTVVEMAVSGEWSAMREAVNRLEKRASFAEATRQRYDTLSSKFKEIQNQLICERNQRNLEIYNKDQEIAILRDKIQDETLNAKIKLEYADKWLCARAESLELQLNKPRDPLPNIEHEKRVHEEIMKLIEMQIKEREESFDIWRKKYAEDLAHINELVIAKREEFLIVTNQHQSLQKLYKEHEGEMRLWLNFKEARAERLAREARLHKAATRIQAWWRGVMVRKALGAFRYLRIAKKPSAKTKKK